MSKIDKIPIKPNEFKQFTSMQVQMNNQFWRKKNSSVIPWQLWFYSIIFTETSSLEAASVKLKKGTQLNQFIC